MKNLGTLTLAFVVLASFISLGVAQKGGPPPGPSPLICPGARHVVLTAPPAVVATPFAADFPTPPPPLEPNFGGTTADLHFRHTFTIPPPSQKECCQCVEGKNTLTIKYEALQNGAAGVGPGNDTVNIYSNGASILSQPLYSGSVTKGQPGTKTIMLKCNSLSNNRLSFAVQDDTSVISATLDLDRCCVNP